MVKVIMGLKGAGKTKKLIELINKAAVEENGNVVCIEKGSILTFDIPYTVRLIQAEDYPFGSYEFFRGFIAGLRSGNYDITHIFIDGLYKLFDDINEAQIEKLLDWCEAFSEKERVKFTISISADEKNVSEGIRKYL